MPKHQKSKHPEHLRPYIFLGLDLDYAEGDKEAVGQCLYCSREKCSVSLATGQYRCLRCGNKGNTWEWIRKLHEISYDQTKPEHYESFAQDRKLMSGNTLRQWELCRSALTDEWLVPGYGSDRQIVTLYRYVRTQERKLLLACPGVGHRMHGLNLLEGQSRVYICEGVWDAMALWEIFNKVHVTDNGFELTDDPKKSVINFSAVVGIAGAGVFKEGWAQHFEDRAVILCCQNDHERIDEKTNAKVPSASYEGMKRIAGMISTDDIQYVEWGEAGWTETLPHGWDVRDQISQ